MNSKRESVPVSKSVRALALGAMALCLTTASIAAAQGPAPVQLGSAGTFAVLSKTGVTDVYASAVIGNVGASPITGASILLTCGEVTGTIYSADAGGPAPCAMIDPVFLTTVVQDMEFAYDDAAGRVAPDFSDLGAGEIGGLTLAPGLYKWGTGLLISTNVTLSGGPDDVWIFQVAGTLNQASATQVTLAGGALPKNIFWQVAGAVTIGTYAHFEGVVLGKTVIGMNTGASVNGRLLAQTAVALQMNAVTQPAAAAAAPPSPPPPPPPAPPVPPVTVTSALVPVFLGLAGNFAVLSKTGVTNVYASAIIGDVGASPITGASILLTCPEVSGTIYTVDAAGLLPCAVIDPVFLTSVVRDMESAYDDAAGRVAPDSPSSALVRLAG